MLPSALQLSPKGLRSMLALAWLSQTAAQTFSAPVLTLRPVVVISMPTEPGKVYQMQASPDLKSWQNEGDPVFGTGIPMLQPMAGGASRFFRLQVVRTPTMGDAPWNMENTALQLNEGTRTVPYSFQFNGQGSIQTSSATKPFSWTWLRHGLDCGLAELTFPDATREMIELTYAAPRAGQFTRRAYIGTRLENSASGSFGPAPSATGTLVPASLTGCTMAFSEQPGGGALTLTSPGVGTRFLDGTSTVFSGSWLVTGISTAHFTANFGSTHGEDYRLTFTGPLTGRYTRQTFTEGVFRDEDQGTFCLTPPP